jgi:hypothetical protein
MIKNLFGYPLIAALTLYFGILNKRKWLLFACFAEVAVFLVQIIALFYQKRNLKIETVLPEAILMEEEKAKAEISLENFGLLPVRRICFFIQYQYLSGKKKRKKDLTVWGNADRESTQRYEIAAGPFPGGQFLFEIKYAEIYDYFGIFSMKIKMKKRRNITVLPEFTDMEVPLLQREVPAENEIDVEKRGQEPGELYDIREYQAGDSLKQIYWKRSAAREELLYRENGALMGVKAVLFFRLPQNTEGMEFHDQLKLAGSFLHSLLECGYIHFFVWGHRESPVLTRRMIRSQEDIWEALAELISGSSQEAFPDGKTWPKKGYGRKKNVGDGRGQRKNGMEADHGESQEGMGQTKAEKRKWHRIGLGRNRREDCRQEEIRWAEEMKHRYEMQFVGEVCPEAFFVLGQKAFGKKKRFHGTGTKTSALLMHETEILHEYGKRG